MRRLFRRGGILLGLFARRWPIRTGAGSTGSEGGGGDPGFWAWQFDQAKNSFYVPVHFY